MTREDIIAMAIEVYGSVHKDDFKFAALVIKSLKPSLQTEFEKMFMEGAAAEREACAKVCDDVQDCGPENGCCPTYWNESLERAAHAIRARNKK